MSLTESSAAPLLSGRNIVFTASYFLKAYMSRRHHRSLASSCVAVRMLFMTNMMDASPHLHFFAPAVYSSSLRRPAFAPASTLRARRGSWSLSRDRNRPDRGRFYRIRFCRDRNWPERERFYRIGFVGIGIGRRGRGFIG